MTSPPSAWPARPGLGSGSSVNLIRDFVELAGVPPAEYARRRGGPVKRDHIALV